MSILDQFVFSLATITEKLNFDFSQEPCLILNKLPPNSLVNGYKLIFIGKSSFYYFFKYNICKMIIPQLLSNLSHFFIQVLLWKLVIFASWLFHLKKEKLNNCDGAVLEIYLDHEFQWQQEGFSCESLA